MNERIEKPEKKDARDEILEKAQQLGYESPEVKELVVQWTEEQEQRVEKRGFAERIKFELERGELYFKMGLFDDAYESACAAMEQAEQFGSEELFNKAQNLAEKVSKA